MASLIKPHRQKGRTGVHGTILIACRESASPPNNYCRVRPANSDDHRDRITEIESPRSNLGCRGVLGHLTISNPNILAITTAAHHDHHHTTSQPIANQRQVDASRRTHHVTDSTWPVRSRYPQQSRSITIKNHSSVRSLSPQHHNTSMELSVPPTVRSVRSPSPSPSLPIHPPHSTSMECQSVHGLHRFTAPWFSSRGLLGRSHSQIQPTTYHPSTSDNAAATQNLQQVDQSHPATSMKIARPSHGGRPRRAGRRSQHSARQMLHHHHLSTSMEFVR